MKWFTATTIILFSLTANATEFESLGNPIKRVLVERDVNISINVFREGEAICKAYDGLKTVTVNSLNGDYSFECFKRGMKVSFSDL